MNYTAHSEIGRIKSVFIKNVKQAFVSEMHIEWYWKELNYLGKPAFNIAVKEFEIFQSVLKEHGAEIFFLPEDSSVNMDSLYCRDAFVATHLGMIIGNMGKALRINEPLPEQKALKRVEFPY